MFLTNTNGFADVFPNVAEYNILCVKGIFLHTDGAGIFQEMNVNICLRRKPFKILQQPLIVMISALNLPQVKKWHLPLNMYDNEQLCDCHNERFTTKHWHLFTKNISVK